MGRRLWQRSDSGGRGLGVVVASVTSHAGVMTLDVGSDRHELAAGDAVMFPGDLPHSYGNAGAEPARFSLTVYEQQTSAARGQENTHHLTPLTR